ncbi:MAG: hypothetical protein ACE5GS_02630 [Kiloniellaceae bacterium]
MLRRLGITVLAILALSGCTTLESLDFGVFRPGGTEAADAWPEPAILDPTAQDLAYVEPARSESAAVEEMPPLPRRKPSWSEQVVLQDPDPELLVGLDFEATKALLGDPALQLEQPPAKVWAYNGGTCMFNVFFYPSMDDNTFRVLTYDVTGGEAQPGGVETSQGESGPVKIRDRDNPILRQCFADLLHGRDFRDAG